MATMFFGQAPSMYQAGGFGPPLGAPPLGAPQFPGFPGFPPQQLQQPQAFPGFPPQQLQQPQGFPGFPPPPQQQSAYSGAPGFAVPQALPPPPAQLATNGHYGIFQASAPVQPATSGYQAAYAAPAAPPAASNYGSQAAPPSFNFGADGDGPREIDWKTEPRNPFRRAFFVPSPPEAHVHAIRQELQIEIEEDSRGIATTPAPIASFDAIPACPEWLVEGLKENGWETPMPIQMQAWPILLSGRDLIGIAQTGSGKTGAFLVPALIHIEDQPVLTTADRGPVVLVMAPTRELAVQISDEANKLMSHSWDGSKHVSGGGKSGMRSVVVYGGGNKWQQKADLTTEGPHVLVGTPGRLIDFITQGTVSLHRVTYLVLDEADRMLDMGFSGDMETICGQCRPERQAVFFSATWTDQVQELAEDFCHENPVRIRVGAKKAQNDAGQDVVSAREGITQEVVVIDFPEWEHWKGAEEKRRLMDIHVRKALEAHPDNKVLVFVNGKDFATELSDKLTEEGFAADCIHGGRKQDMRLWSLDEFRKGNVKVLVATDVIGRGLDIPNVSHVVVFEMGSVEDYVHRIGRTGRGKEGGGHAMVFFEYFWKMPETADELISVLERAKQVVPPELRTIADEVKAGTRKVVTKADKDKEAEWAESKAAARELKRAAKENGTWVDAKAWNKTDWTSKNDWKSKPY